MDYINRNEGILTSTLTLYSNILFYNIFIQFYFSSVEVES